LCRLATGGGFSTRQLYTDSSELLLNVQRPVVINGIEELAQRADLLDRSVLLSLPRITDGMRRDEESLWSAFEAARPRLLGALLDAVVMAVAGWRNIRLRISAELNTQIGSE
jgi:hypothetical protein